MRLTCPNCETAYDVPAAQIPEGGRHVQCTGCHTRWFVRREPEPEPSEDAIIRRLEARPRPAVVTAPAAVAPVMAPVMAPAPEPQGRAEPDAPMGFVWESPVPAPSPAPATGAAAPPPAPALREAPPGVPALPAEPPRPRALPGAPEPAAARPQAHHEARRPASHPLRLDLAADQAASEAGLLPRSRFGRGVFIALLLCALALATYLLAAPLAARFPRIAPWIADYVEAVDELREAVTSPRPAP